eukprot:314872-Amphidinium_carterae.2
MHAPNIQIAMHPEVIATASMFGPRGTSSCFDSASGRSMQLQRVTFGRMVFEYTAGPQYSQRTSTSRCDFTRCLKRCKRLARSRGAIRVAILAPTAADDEEDPRAIRQEIRISLMGAFPHILSQI